MKTAKLLLLSLVTVGFSFPAAWAGEPNTALFGNEQSQVKSDRNANSKATQGRDCPPEMSHQKDGQHTGTQHSEGQYSGVLKE
jgi:hypothetical protein